MASHESSRKRVKMSRPESKQTPATTSSIASTSASTMNQGNNCATNPSCHHEQALKALNTDIDAMRQLVTCKICDRLLYEPYSLSCGHTYCYVCLSQWLVESRKKTCPDCRAVVSQQPTPSYVIRELVVIFTSRNELLADDETTEEHNKYVKEEGEIVAKDRANTDPRTGGLFKGVFKRGAYSRYGPIHDPGDGVDRCPTCTWELEHGYCNHCGQAVDPQLGFSDIDSSDITDDELDHEIDEEDAREVFGADGEDGYLDRYLDEDDLNLIGAVGVPYRGEPGPNGLMLPPPPPRRWRPDYRARTIRSSHRPIDLQSSDEEESEEDEPEENLDGFVVNDDNIDYESNGEDDDTDVPARARHRPMSRRRAPVVISDDEEDTAASAGAPPESEPDSDEEGPIIRGSQRNKRGRMPLRQGREITISSDEESSDGGGADDQESEQGGTGGFSSLESVAGDYTSPAGDSEYDSDGVSSVHPGYNQQRYDEVNFDEDAEDDEDSDGSDDGDGWGMRTETPSNSRRLTSSSSHRLQTRGQRSGRHSSFFGGRSIPPLSPPMPTRTNGAAPRHAFPGYSAIQADAENIHRQMQRQAFQSNINRGTLAARPLPQSSSMFRGSPSNEPLPGHPFQLGNTLHQVNHRNANSANNNSRNFNQRSQQLRSHHGYRTTSAESSRSSNSGGVHLHSDGSSSSSSTVGPASFGRRKRGLSISSDDSLEGARAAY